MAGIIRSLQLSSLPATVVEKAFYLPWCKGLKGMSRQNFSMENYLGELVPTWLIGWLQLNLVLKEMREQDRHINQLKASIRAKVDKIRMQIRIRRYEDKELKQRACNTFCKNIAQYHEILKHFSDTSFG